MRLMMTAAVLFVLLASTAGALANDTRAVTATTAAAAPSHAVGLSATGFLLPFTEGAIEVLVNQGVVQPGFTPVAGSSGGSIFAAALCAQGGRETAPLHAALERFAEGCRRAAACAFTQDRAVRALMADILDSGVASGDDDEAVAQRCAGRAFAAISRFGGGGGGSKPSSSSLLTALLPARSARALRAAWRSWWRPEAWLVGEGWQSRGDLTDGVAASCFFPLLSSARRPWASFRGVGRLADGVFAAPLPLPPSESRLRPLRVSAVPLGTSAAPMLSPPILEAEIAPFLRIGAEQGLAELEAAGLPSAARWGRYLLLVPDARQRAAMRELGRREAMAWWREVEQGSGLSIGVAAS